MQAKRKYITLFALCTLTIFFVPASVQAKTADELKVQYGSALATGNKVKILIVPGHDDEYWGTEFGDTRESDVVVAIGEELYAKLKNDPRLDVSITRTQTGYTKTFSDYFVSNRAAIEQFIATKTSEAKRKIVQGEMIPYEGVAHNNAHPEVAIRLYGINRWVNENGVDIVLHLHINDHGGRRWGREGDYNGMVIFVPERQLANSATSKLIAGPLLAELLEVFSVSTMPKEDTGLAEDQELIALGASHTLDSAASLLIEYGYIYEDQYKNVPIRELVAPDLGFRTYLGLYRFFGGRDIRAGEYESTLLPFNWKVNLRKGLEYNTDVLRLQVALRSRGLYPANGKTHADCPASGTFGPCTKNAVETFQKKYGLPATGFVGPMTRAKLNSLFAQ